MPNSRMLPSVIGGPGRPELAPNLGSPYRKENRSFDKTFCPDPRMRIEAVLWV
jgi:hypothetical protein